jgi:hypothetical protein
MQEAAGEREAERPILRQAFGNPYLALVETQDREDRVKRVKERLKLRDPASSLGRLEVLGITG